MQTVMSKYTNKKGETRFIVNLSDEHAAQLANGEAPDELTKGIATLLKRKSTGKEIRFGSVEEPVEATA